MTRRGDQNANRKRRHCNERKTIDTAQRNRLAVGFLLSAQIKQFIDQLLAGRDDSTVASVLGTCQHQSDQVFANVRIAQLERTTDNISDTVFTWAALDGKSRVNASRV